MNKEQRPIDEPVSDFLAHDQTHESILVNGARKGPTSPHIPDVLWPQIVHDSGLSQQDRWNLAHSCSRFYKLLHAELLQPKAYSFGVIPLGLLDDPIFRRYPLNYHVLINILNRYRRIESTFKLPYLDDQMVWALAALTGMEAALEELIDSNPWQHDLNGFAPLYFIVLGGHLNLAQKWIEKYYPRFTFNDEPELLLAAMASENEALVRYFINDHRYPLNFGLESPAYNETFGWRCLEFGYSALFSEIVAPAMDLYLHKEYHQVYPAYAALYGHWKFYDEIMSKGHPSTVELRRIVVRAAARDDKDRFMELIKEFEDARLLDKMYEDDADIAADSEEYESYLNHLTLRCAFIYACKGGQIEIVDYLANLGLIAFDGFVASHWGIRAQSLSGDRMQYADFAALYGQIKLIKHLESTNDLSNQVPYWSESIFYFATMHGDWDKFIHLINLYHNGKYDNFYGDGYPSHKADSNNPLDCAIEKGNLYFVQRLITPPDIRRFAFIEENGFLENAEASKNHSLVRFIKSLVELGKKAQEELELAAAAKKEEENQKWDELGEPADSPWRFN